jgi:hypothetical protein
VCSIGAAPSRSTSLTVFCLTGLLTAISTPICSAQLGPSDQRFYANAKPYLEEAPERLVVEMPELRGLRPAADQQPLSLILASTGHVVEAYFNNLIDLIAHEDVDQELLNAHGAIKRKQHQKYDYLILLHRDELPPRLEEYRTPPGGNQTQFVQLGADFPITSGFAFNCMHFFPDYRSDSTFRYLGEQVLDSRNTFVVAFAQQPAKARSLDSITIGSQVGGTPVLLQGIAWIDQSSYQILQLRTDFLAPRPDLHITAETTEVTFAQFRLSDLPNPLWLPLKVTVSTDYNGHSYLNQHVYSDYRRFRVAVKMLPR